MIKAYILACLLSFLAGLLLDLLVAKVKAAKQRKRRIPGGGLAPQKEPFIKRFGVMNMILVIIAVSIYLFVDKMIDLFELYGTVPDSLITCFFAVVGGECGVMGWIKTTQDKKQDRQWLKEDQQQAKEDSEKLTDKPTFEMEDASNV